MGCFSSKTSTSGSSSARKPRYESSMNPPNSGYSLQLVAITSKLSGPTVATISNGVSVTKFCINQVIAAVGQSVRKMAIAEATKGRGLCGKSNKVIQADSGGLGTSVIVPWLSMENNGCDVGQGIGELEGLEVKAKASDASQLVVKDLEEFVCNL